MVTRRARRRARSLPGSHRRAILRPQRFALRGSYLLPPLVKPCDLYFAECGAAAPARAFFLAFALSLRSSSAALRRAFWSSEKRASNAVTAGGVGGAPTGGGGAAAVTGGGAGAAASATVALELLLARVAANPMPPRAIRPTIAPTTTPLRDFFWNGASRSSLRSILTGRKLLGT